MNELLKEMLRKDTTSAAISDRELQEKILARRLGQGDAPPTVAVRPAEQSSAANDTTSSSNGEANPSDATEDAHRPRRGARWWAIRGCVTTIAVLASCAAAGSVTWGIRQREVDPRANPEPYARPTILAFGPPDAKMAILNQFDDVLRDCAVGRPSGTPGRVDEEFLYARPLWYVYDRVRSNDVEQLYNFVTASADANVSASVGQSLRNDLPSLVQAISAEQDPYRKIDIFVGQIAKGLQTDLSTQHKIESLKLTLWQGETNRQHTPAWGTLPSDYFVLPSGSHVCKIAENETGAVIARSEPQVTDTSKMGFRRRVAATRASAQRDINKRG